MGCSTSTPAAAATAPPAPPAAAAKLRDEAPPAPAKEVGSAPPEGSWVTAAEPAQSGAPDAAATWATKTESAKSMSSAAARQFNAVIVSDEGDDSLEAIATELGEPAEEPPASEPMAGVLPTPAASAPRPPTARGSGVGPVGALGPVAEEEPPSVQPLPRQQLEEAAKLAETRRRFDNQRYQQPALAKGNSANSLYVNVCHGEGLLNTSIDQAWPGTPTVVPSRRVVGLSLNTGVTGTGAQPPGMVEELEAPAAAPESKAEKRSSLPGSRGFKSFDADDEALMAEIIDEVGNV